MFGNSKTFASFPGKSGSPRGPKKPIESVRPLSPFSITSNPLNTTCPFQFNIRNYLPKCPLEDSNDTLAENSSELKKKRVCTFHVVTSFISCSFEPVLVTEKTISEFQNKKKFSSEFALS